MDNKQILVKHIKRRFQFIVNRDKILNSLLKEINAQNNVYIIGGWLRDCIYSYKYKTRFNWDDLDLVVDGVVYEDNLPAYLKNNLGGYRVNISNRKHVDFWNLNDTYAFRKGYLEPSLQNLIESTVFTINSLVYDIKSSSLLESNAINDISNGIIRFNFTKYLNSFPELQVYRIYNYYRKYSFNIAEDVQSFLKQYKENTPLKLFYKSILKHKMWLSQLDAENIYNFIDNLKLYNKK